MEEGLWCIVKFLEHDGYKIQQLYNRDGMPDRAYRISLPFGSQVEIFHLDFDEFYHISLENNHRHFYAETEAIGTNDRYVAWVFEPGLLDMVRRFNAFLQSFADDLTARCVALFVGLSRHGRFVNSDVRKMIVRQFYADARERILETLNT